MRELLSCEGERADPVGTGLAIESRVILEGDISFTAIDFSSKAK